MSRKSKLLEGVDQALIDKAAQAECFITPQWAADAILARESLTTMVLDPACGDGVLGRSLRERGYETREIDLYDWGVGTVGVNFLEQTNASLDLCQMPFSIMMNSPFTLTCDFIRHAFALGAKKILNFQRFAWFESAVREEFFKEFRPSRIYLCGDRASCWLKAVPEHRRKGQTPTAYAWSVFETTPSPEITFHWLYKPKVEKE